MDAPPFLPIFASGLVIGLSLAAPVGPIGVLTIRRTLAQGRWIGFISGLGTATADALYGLIGALGLTVLVRALNAQAFWLQLAGGLFLCYLGVRTFLSAPATQPAAAGAQTKAFGAATSAAVSAYSSAFLLTLTNPATILSFIGIFAGLDVAPHGSGSSGSALIVVLGVFAGSAAWWFFLSGVTSLLRARLSPVHLLWVNRASGVIMLAFGLVALGRAAGVGI